MAKKIEMKAMSDEDRKINDIKHMAQRIEAAILETMEKHPDYENLTIPEGTTILLTAICEIFQTIADVTKTNVNDHLDIFMNGIEIWKQSKKQ